MLQHRSRGLRVRKALLMALGWTCNTTRGSGTWAHPHHLHGQHLLEDAGIVYETGELTSKQWKDMQKLPGSWYVRLSAIESFGVLK